MTKMAQIWAPKTFFTGFTFGKMGNQILGLDFDQDLVLKLFFLMSFTSTRCYILSQTIFVYNFKAN